VGQRLDFYILILDLYFALYNY